LSNKDTKIIKPQKSSRQYERESNVIYQIETFQSDKKNIALENRKDLTWDKNGNLI
jgi:hypothetical protein